MAYGMNCDGLDLAREATMVDKSSVELADGRAKQLQQISWSDDLQVDLLNLIIDRLSNFVDKINFRAVCKSWRRTKSPIKDLPWLLDHSWDYDNSGDFVMSRTFYIPRYGDMHTKHVIESEDRFGAGICASKHGWLLFQKNMKSWFYNPFTKQVIDLPDINFVFNRVTFSSAPTSPDCLCLTIQASKNKKKILVATCSPGDKSWQAQILDGFNGVIEDVVYGNRRFFCFFKGGFLAVYDPQESKDGRWNVLIRRPMLREIIPFSRTQMIECNGQLLLIIPCEIFIVMKFDCSLARWVKIDTLGNHVLFLGCTSFAVPAEGALSDMADRIYYHSNIQTRYYSMRTKQSYKCSYYTPSIKKCQNRTWIEHENYFTP